MAELSLAVEGDAARLAGNSAEEALSRSFRSDLGSCQCTISNL